MIILRIMACVMILAVIVYTSLKYLQNTLGNSLMNKPCGFVIDALRTVEELHFIKEHVHDGTIEAATSAEIQFQDSLDDKIVAGGLDDYINRDILIREALIEYGIEDVNSGDIYTIQMAVDMSHGRSPDLNKYSEAHYYNENSDEPGNLPENLSEESSNETGEFKTLEEIEEKLSKIQEDIDKIGLPSEEHDILDDILKKHLDN